jgi:hypothetical protein
VEPIGHPRGDARAWRRARVACLLALVGILCLLTAKPAVAAGSYSPTFKDRVIGGPVPATSSATASSSGSYPVAGGGTVRIDVDPAYAGTDALQRILDTLGATVHGAEMNNLTVHIADDSNLFGACGQNATACYFPSSRTMVVSGSPINPNNQMPQAMVITHEYGHHIEANRSFPGWYASNLGARHWATYEHVCEGVAAGRLFPGDEGAHYWENPGEAFAQAYATMLYPNAVPWWWSFAEPDQGAFDAIRADVADTSQGTQSTWSARLAPGSPTASTTINASLDGPVSVKVRQPRKARLRVQLLSASGTVLTSGQSQLRFADKKKGRKKGKKGRKASKPAVTGLTYDACGAGARTFQLQVTRLAGKGTFTAEIVRP